MPYHVAEGTACKGARPGEKPQDHVTQDDQRFADDELVASPFDPPTDDSAARWARRGWFVFRRGDWYLIVIGYEVDEATYFPSPT